eukprot:5209037-Prymnesium_polylepis.1
MNSRIAPTSGVIVAGSAWAGCIQRARRVRGAAGWPLCGMSRFGSKKLAATVSPDVPVVVEETKRFEPDPSE